MSRKISVILPARNECGNLRVIIPELLNEKGGDDWEIIVVDDGSEDDTPALIESYSEVILVKHSYNKGNGAAIKSGVRAATGDILVFMDADGQHKPADIRRLIAGIGDGYDMVVGSRRKGSQAGFGRSVANGLYNILASYMTGHHIADLTSGFRAVKAKKFKEFLYLLPNGFSYPTTCTMAFFRAGYSVIYKPIHAAKRIGKSHIRPLKDGTRFLLIIFKVGTLYSPLKLFAPMAFTFFVLGLGWYAYTFATISRFTNMSALLLTGSFIVFMMGLISEQITALMYRPQHDAFESKRPQPDE